MGKSLCEISGHGEGVRTSVETPQERGGRAANEYVISGTSITLPAGQ